MADSIRDLLAASGVLGHVVLPTEIEVTMSALEVAGPISDLGGGITTGAVSLAHDLSKSPIPGFDFALGLPEAGITVPFKPDTDSIDGVITLGLEPSTVVFGSSNIGFECPWLIIDDSDTAAGPGAGAPALDPPKASIDADTPSWRGILARQIDFWKERC